MPMHYLLLTVNTTQWIHDAVAVQEVGLDKKKRYDANQIRNLRLGNLTFCRVKKGKIGFNYQHEAQKLSSRGMKAE